MLDFLKNEHIVNTCIILLLIALLIMTFVNFTHVNGNVTQYENYCGCNYDKTQPQPVQLQPLVQVVSQNNSNNNNKVGGNKLILYYAMWCGYSKQFLPVWEKIKAEVNSKQELNVSCEQYECDEQREICNVEQIDGFPSMILVKSDGTKIPYKNQRSVEAVLSFLNTNNN
jgi:thiol-disulfide isomerase/thioredoxin